MGNLLTPPVQVNGRGQKHKHFAMRNVVIFVSTVESGRNLGYSQQDNDRGEIE